MQKAAAKEGDLILSTDTHIVITAQGPTPMKFPFKGIIDSLLSSNVNIMGKSAAIVGSQATNTPPHIPIGGTFQKPPHNRGTITSGSKSVFINNKPAARTDDKATTCNDPNDLPVGIVNADSTVMIGD